MTVYITAQNTQYLEDVIKSKSNQDPNEFCRGLAEIDKLILKFTWHQKDQEQPRPSWRRTKQEDYPIESCDH